jgi:hypothetical protein
MNNRSIVTIIFALFMVLLVMGVSVFFALNGKTSAEKYSAETLWSKSAAVTESMKIIDLTADGQNDLFVQGSSFADLYDGAGNVIGTYSLGFGKSTMGDVDGDGVDDIVLYQPFTPMVQAVIKGQSSTIAETVSMAGSPARVAIMKFASGTEIVLGNDNGAMMALDIQGSPLWNQAVGNEEIRGLDDARVGGALYLAAASHSGSFGVYDSNGAALWSASTEQLRRMRAYDLNGDGNSEILTGGEYGEFAIWNAANGQKTFAKNLGQPISEIRPAEINSDPTAREIIVGGKDGGVWAFDINGKELWSGSVSDKVTEILGADLTDDGKDEVIIGDDSGGVHIFSGAGSRAQVKTFASGITRIDEGKLNNERVVVISDQSQLDVMTMNHTGIPGFQFTPILVGLILSAAIIAVAWILATLPAKPEMKVSIQDKSRESLEAERRMLKESIADVERLRQSGEVTGGAYLSRLKQLRSDLAENEAAFKTAGFPIKVETIQCPNCGGTLNLGVDKCDYCGHVILT